MTFESLLRVLCTKLKTKVITLLKAGTPEQAMILNPVLIKGKILGKIVLSVAATLCKSLFSPRLLLGSSSFVLFVFLLSLQCLVMAQALKFLLKALYGKKVTAETA